MIFSLLVLLILIRISLSGAVLDANYYQKTCPQVEDIIYTTVRNATTHDVKVSARILRMFFHDCFIRGCDASVLLDSTPNNKAEKDGHINFSLAAFESGGPSWSVLKGRKDGRISRAEETKSLPLSHDNTSQLIHSFSQKGLSVKDLVTLSGGHTLGRSRCTEFAYRLRNFSSAHDTDPTLDPEFAAELKEVCPIDNKDPNAGANLDKSGLGFDNDYYKRIVRGRGLLVSDQTLLGDHRTRWRVEALARYQRLFFRDFGPAMVRLGNVGVDESGEVRLDCRVVN
ncbi:UNVERIFIED_CONTAM: Peroxidase 66 [Sesamum radiatum]|uniref:Peroxidase n=1 Tax=Sesamum radiatum TaxID=300843 RepID=A0AAW2TFN1_SESRA